MGSRFASPAGVGGGVFFLDPTEKILPGCVGCKLCIHRVFRPDVMRGTQDMLMNSKAADWAMIYSITGLVVVWITGIFLEASPLHNSVKIPMTIVGGSAVIILIFFMLFCLGRAMDMNKGTEKNLWIIGILFATPIAVPYFYFKFISRRHKALRKDGAENDVS